MGELLKDKVAVVTGAGHGLGQAIALRFASEGAKIVIFEISEERAADTMNKLKEMNAIAKSYVVDIADFSIIQPTVKEIVDTFGRIDIWVNNAGIIHNAAIEDVDIPGWDRLLDINLKAVFFWSQEVFKVMKAQNYGKFVHMSSLAGLRAGRISAADYTASKSGVLGVSRCLALGGAKFGITSNAICPGLIRTGMVNMTEERRAELAQEIPMGRFGVPDEVAKVALFLASDLSSYVTGAYISVNGGQYIN